MVSVPQTSNKIMRDILIIDGLNLFVRSFMINETTNVSGTLVGGTVGFLKSLNFLVKKYKPYKIFVIWEQGGACPRRKNIFADYKANRLKNKELGKAIKHGEKETNPFSDQKNRIYQLLLLNKLLGFLPVCQIYVPETECDDIIGYLVKYKLKDENFNKIIVSSDKDFYQLLDYENVKIYDPGRKHEVDKFYVMENFGPSPKNITLARTLCGDPSDNVPGVNGVGFKTLLKHFPELKSEETDLNPTWIIERAKAILEENQKQKKKKPLKVIQEISESFDTIFRNWQLMYLESNNLQAIQIDKINYKIDNHQNVNNKLEYLKIFTANDIAVTQDLEKIPDDMAIVGIL